MEKRNFVASLLAISIFLTLISLNYASAAYVADIYFTVPETVYTANESIGFKGYLYRTNYSDNGSLFSASAPLTSAYVNLTIKYSNGSKYRNYTLTTDSNGSFYSKSTFYPTATEINISTTGYYHIRAEYKDPLNSTWFSEVEVSIVNQTLDILTVSAERAEYNPSETVRVNAEAIRLVGDKILHISNISINGSLRNSSKGSLQTFSCTTGTNGKCTITLTAPSTYGSYILELNNFKAFGAFYVSPFSVNVYMKDELGKSVKNVFALGEQGRIEVSVVNTSATTDAYTFSGYITDSSGNNIKTINSTTLNSNNSFTNTFLFTVDALTFRYGSYTSYITVAKAGDGSVNFTNSFQVNDWTLSINKRTSNAGFEYEYSVFPNKTMYFEAYPSDRANGSVILGINSSFFSIKLKDNLNNIVSVANATWNASCGKGGCYEFSINSSGSVGKYTLYVTLSNAGDTQTKSQSINVISTVMSAQSTDKDGAIKDLFGTNEFIYLKESAYNLTASAFNLTNAELFIVSYMNGSQLNYTQVANFSDVNSSNDAYEWAWNSSAQMIKMDAPKIGGLYNAFLFGENRTAGTTAKFILNPYDVCTVPKDTAGQVSSGYYYVWQFKTTDTVYFEIKITQANNPSGKATALNSSTAGNTSGMGAQCNVDTTTKQVVNNATIAVGEVKNIESGAIQRINTTDSICQSSDSSGGYTCTVKPYTKWDGGANIVKFSVVGQDGTETTVYSRFEARAFYLYGWAQTYQNSPASGITLSVRLYEAGGNWWGSSGSSGGLSGTIVLKKIEYQGRDGEWIWPPVSYTYNTSNVTSATVTSGVGTLSLPPPVGGWKTGYYRAVIQGTTSGGDTDYGYAWFGVKMWDVYGQPVECMTTIGCNYKSYFNSRENISLYIKISKAGDYNYNYGGGENIWGNVTIGVKKIQDCRTWPCKELNTSAYTVRNMTVSQSSPWYWNANTSQQRDYTLWINTTTGNRWGTGYYSVVLDVNGTDTGYAWFNTVAFYVDTQPTDLNGTNYRYNIRGNNPMYFNVTTAKSYKQSFWDGSNYIRYNRSDYVNTTLDSIVLRVWDQTTWTQKTYNYPADINVSRTNITGNTLLNLTFNGSSGSTWPSGYYWGELTLRNAENETSTGWLWFNVQPFRVQVNTIGNTYNMDAEQCINTTVSIYDPDWYSNTPLNGNYSIVNVTEDVWTNYGRSTTYYTNYTVINYSSGSFNATANVRFCPNNDTGLWSSGSWGGYHYLNIIVKENVQNETQTGWLSFRTMPFQISWGSVVGGVGKVTNQEVNVTVSLTKASGAATSGNLTQIYQWRYDNYQSTREEYVFRVGQCPANGSAQCAICWSNVSGQCNLTGTQTITIYPPSGGWKLGYNYLYAEWTKENSAAAIQDWGYIYFEGRGAYNGYFSNVDLNGYWKYDFRNNENLTIRINVRDSSYNAVNVNITSVEYALSGSNCWSDWCRSYTSATYWPTNTTGGTAILQIQYPSSRWSIGNYYYIRATVSSSAGTSTISEGSVRVKDMTAPNVTIVAPVNNATYNLSSTISFNATTTENSQCHMYAVNYNTFYNWYCSSWNASNGTGNASYVPPDAQTIGACNTSLYHYKGANYYTEYLSRDYRSIYDGSNSSWAYSDGGFVSTGGTTHGYILNTTNWTAQSYGIRVWCYDSDWNSGMSLVAFNVTRM